MEQGITGSWMWIIIFVLLVIMIISMVYNKYCQKTKKKDREATNSENKLDNKAISFFDECNRYVARGEQMTEVISIVGQKYGLSDIASATAYYKKGKKEKEKEKVVLLHKEKEKLQELHKKEQLECNEVAEKRLLTGKEKYLVTLRKWIELITSQKKISEITKTIASNNARYRAQQSDWAVAGGIGSALGGTAVGLAAAMNVQAKNKREKERAENIRAMSKEQSKVAFEMEYAATSEEKKAINYLRLMESVLIDEQKKEEKFELLKCANIKINFTEGKNLMVSFDIKEVVSTTILSKRAILDGVLKVSIYNKNNECISYGYYMAEGYDKYNYILYAGFKVQNHIKVICPIDKFENIHDLRCEITPDSLWLIEADWNSDRSISDLTIKQEYEEYKEACIKRNDNVLSVTLLNM